MNKQQPMLMESPLTKRVFVVTSYKDNGDGTYTALQKHDVTEQFDALAAARRGECECVWNEQEGTFRCSSCDTLLTNEISIEWPSHKVTPITLPNYCRNCGKAVKR